MGRHKGTGSRFSHMPWEWGFKILPLFYVLCFGTAVDILMDHEDIPDDEEDDVCAGRANARHPPGP